MVHNNPVGSTDDSSAKPAVAYDVIAEFYDVFGFPEDEDAVIDFTRAACFEEKADFTDKRVLDWGCGTGRLACRLAEAGAAVTALDRSPGMLAQADKRLKNLEGTVRHLPVLAEGDLLAPMSVDRFDLVIAATDVLNHFPTEKLPRVFDRAAALLKPGGYFVFDALRAEFLAKDRGDNTFYYEAPGDRPTFTLVWENDYDPEDAIAISDLTLYKLDGESYRRAVDRIIEYTHAPADIAAAAAAEFTLATKRDDEERVRYAYRLRR